jgi:hypothetical protein
MPAKSVARIDWTHTHFSTGQIAQVLGVAPRTVNKWFDGGFLKGYRLPDLTGKHLSDRRVSRESLLEFMREREIPLTGTGLFRVLLVGTDKRLEEAIAGVFGDTICLRSAVSVFSAGLSCAGSVPDLVVLDMGLGKACVLDVMLAMSSGGRPARVVLLANEDDQAPEVAGVEVLAKPLDATRLLRLIKETAANRKVAV